MMIRLPRWPCTRVNSVVQHKLHPSLVQSQSIAGPSTGLAGNQCNGAAEGRLHSLEVTNQRAGIDWDLDWGWEYKAERTGLDWIDWMWDVDVDVDGWLSWHGWCSAVHATFRNQNHEQGQIQV